MSRNTLRNVINCNNYYMSWLANDSNVLTISTFHNAPRSTTIFPGELTLYSRHA